MPPKTAEPHTQLVSLAIKVRDQCAQLLLDRNIDQELKKQRQEYHDLKRRIEKFLTDFRQIADELVLGLDSCQQFPSSEDSDESL